MKNLLKHAAIPAVQYSPSHFAAEQAIAAWKDHIKKYLKRRHPRIHEDPSFDLQVNDTLRNIVRTVYINRGQAARMGFKTLCAHEIASWLDEQTEEHFSAHATPSSRFEDVRAAHSRVSALLRGYWVLCPKHFGPMNKGLPCPKIKWNLRMVAAPISEASTSWALYEEHLIDDFIHEQRRAGKRKFPQRSAPAQLDREVTACTLWYIYLIFGRLHFNGLPRLQAQSPLYTSETDSQRTVLSAIAERFSSIYWQPKQFTEKGRKYVEREHGDIHAALTRTKKPDGEPR